MSGQNLKSVGHDASPHLVHRRCGSALTWLVVILCLTGSVGLAQSANAEKTEVKNAPEKPRKTMRVDQENNSADVVPVEASTSTKPAKGEESKADDSGKPKKAVKPRRTMLTDQENNSADVDPVDPTKVDEPTEPEKPKKPKKPKEPAEPAEPTEPTKPTETVEPTEPTPPEKAEPQTEAHEFKTLSNWLSQFSTTLPGGGELFWDKGLRWYSADERLKFKFGGKWMLDFTTASGSDLERDLGIDLGDSLRCRRVRPYIAGEFDDRFAFKIEADFARQGTTLIDAYVQFRKIPSIGNITVGHIKEPFGLERLTSSASTTFLERSLSNTLVPTRAWGVMANDHAMDSRMTWSLGVFKDTDDQCSGSGRMGNACAITGRVTFLPMYEDKGRRLVHLGLGYSLRRPSDRVKFRSRPEARFVDILTDTQDIDADSVQLLGSEIAWVEGPFSMQAEYVATLVNTADAGRLCLNGFYVQASYLLTGEHRPYNRSLGVFSGVRPKHNFRENGWGAWEVAARYSFLDLNANNLPVSARRMQDLTLGLNWYLNQNVRIGWNYIHSRVDGSDTSAAANIALMRIQIAF